MSITKQRNNTYTWSCAIDADYHRQTIRPGLYACIGIAGFLLLFGGLLSWQYQDWENFWIVAASTVVFLLITAICFGFVFSIKDPYERYELSDIYVKIGSGKSSVYYDFKKIRQISFYPKYIEVRGKIRRARIYVQEGEDMEFVKRHIRNLGLVCFKLFLFRFNSLLNLTEGVKQEWFKKNLIVQTRNGWCSSKNADPAD